MERFRVRAANKNWSNKGPDLLRPRDNARKALSGLLDPGAPVKLAVRREKANGEFSAWVPCSRKVALEKFDAWKHAGDIFQVGIERPTGTYELAAAVKFEDVKLIETSCVSEGTERNRSLIEHQFPGIKFAGGYVWKQISGSTSWSDHAWGTAIDETENKPRVSNDRVTDWCARMARAGCMDFDYVLGSRAGKVVSCSAPDFDIRPSSASTSHLWHVHMSVVDHDGRRPPKQGVEC